MKTAPFPPTFHSFRMRSRYPSSAALASCPLGVLHWAELEAQRWALQPNAMLGRVDAESPSGREQGATSSWSRAGRREREVL